ncbi:MAG: replicative DNA helicase [bacterium]
MSAAGKIVDAALPQSLDAEKAVLGAMILDPHAIDIVSGILTADQFYHTGHQELFKAIRDLHERGVAVDFTTLIDETRRRKQLEKVGGPGFITALEQYVFDVEKVDHHAGIVRQKYQLRQLISVTQLIQQDAYLERDDAQHILDSAEQKIFDLSEQHATRDFLQIGHLTTDALEEIERRSAMSREGLEADYASGILTGYTDLDEWTGGFQRSDLIILAARPSIGKTALGLNIALNVGAGVRSNRVNAVKARPVGIFSLEMSAIQINQRLLSSLSRISMHFMRTGSLTAPHKAVLHAHAKGLHDAPIFVDDSPGISVLELRAKARRLKARCPDLSLIVVDYLQLMHSGGRHDNRQQEIAEITRSLKALARELNLPVIALSQLSRLIEQRKGRNAKPVLSDLRESGAIEQDADVVLFIHREKKYERLDEGESERERATHAAEVAELIIGKQRNGPTGSIHLVFFRETATFANAAHRLGDEEGPGF